MGDHLAKNRTSMKKEESNLWTKTLQQVCRRVVVESLTKKHMLHVTCYSHDHVKEEQYAVGRIVLSYPFSYLYFTLFPHLSK